jgi:signal transduction histidine kinase
VVLALGFLSSALTRYRTLDGTALLLADTGLRCSLALLPAFALHFFASLPDGRLYPNARRTLVITGYVVALVLGVSLLADRDTLARFPLMLAWVVAASIGLALAHPRYRSAGAVDRRRMQWIGLGLAVAAEAAIVVIALHLLVDMPQHWGDVLLAITGIVPLTIIVGSGTRLVFRVDRVLSDVVALAGLSALVLVIYVVVVLGLGRAPEGRERTLLLLSMAAAGVVALLYLPARRWLNERANRIVYGERVAPDESLRTFGQRLTRAIPLDELLLQLVESLRKSMGLASAAVWTGRDGVYELAASVPHGAPPPLHVGPDDRNVVARAGVSGGTWVSIWLADLAAAHGDAIIRVAPIAHQGELLGLIVCTRRADGESFSAAEDATLSELARQVGLALHNVQLDSALQASLEELQRANEDLRDSRARIVSAGDAERRKLERNLHDGAQQHLVAMAVKLRLARDAIEDDPADSAEMIDELRSDLQTAIQELRALAHGIFPPLLVSGGLAEALPAAAQRSALPTTLDVLARGRYGDDAEAAVYFCVLEALQNAGKHAGDGAKAKVLVEETDGLLRFEVSDDGKGFDQTAVMGHGFVNMADRLGAMGGSVHVRSALGEGTTVSGSLPI